MNRKLIMFLLLLFVGLGNALAQRTITGKVTGTDGEPILGATIAIKGSTIGTISGMDGAYHLNIPANVNNDTIVFSYIGKTTIMEAIAGRTTINPVMEDDDVNVEEVVVTALGISRKEKTLGYAATKVDADDITGARTANVADALAGKVAGVQVASTSSNPGALSNMVIRGYSSINGSNQPLYVIDGIPVTNRSTTSGDVTFATGGISNLSANDIESLTVLKGAAATALYGSRAANGVVVITTKQGKKSGNKNFTIEYDGNVKARRASYFADMQNDFGQGWNGAQTWIENGSWGPKLDGSKQLYGPIYDGKQLWHYYDAKKTNVEDFLETGWSQSHALSINGTSDDSKVTYYLSYSMNKDNGIMPGDRDVYTRKAIAYRATYKANDWLKLSSSINFSRFTTEGLSTDQGVTAIDGLYELPRDVSIVDMQDLSNIFNTPTAYFTPYGITNPYWAIENSEIALSGKEVFGKLQADFTPLKDFTFTYRLSFDYADSDAKIGIPKIAVDEALMWDDKGYAPSNMNQAGDVIGQYSKRNELNHDFLANWNRKFMDDKLDVAVTAGVNINEREAASMTSGVNDLSIETGFWDLSNGATKETMSEGASKRRLIGLLGDVTVGWKDMVFFGYSFRNDWSSTLPIDANSYFYQGVTASFIFTELIPQNNILSFGKVRLAYGTTGNDASPYCTADSFVQSYANAYYGANVAKFPINGINAYHKAATAGNQTLKPEMTNEAEAGLNLQFLNGRFGLDVALYNRKTKDQIFTLPVDPSTGYSSMMVNYGEVENKGVEILLNTTPVKIKDFKWDLDFNFAKNNNNVISLPKELEGGKTSIESFGAGSDAIYMYVEEGEPFGVFYTYEPTYDDQGHIIVDANGLPILTDEIQKTGKTVQADFTAGVSTKLSWKGIALSANLDISKGGYMLSRTKNIMEFTGNGIYTTYNGRNPFVIPNSVIFTGDKEDKAVYGVNTFDNTTPISLNGKTLQEYFDQGGVVGGEHYLTPRTYAKLRNITLAYDLPKAWVRYTKLSEISFGIFCNNVYFWTAKENRFIDPENTSYADDGDLHALFGETYCNPSCRTWGFNLNVKF